MNHYGPNTSEVKLPVSGIDGTPVGSIDVNTDSGHKCLSPGRSRSRTTTEYFELVTRTVFHSRFNWTVIEKKRAWAVSPPESPKSSIIHARQETTFKRGVRTNTFQDVRAAYLQAFSSGEVGNCLGTSPE